MFHRNRPETLLIVARLIGDFEVDGFLTGAGGVIQRHWDKDERAPGENRDSFFRLPDAEVDDLRSWINWRAAAESFVIRGDFDLRRNERRPGRVRDDVKRRTNIQHDGERNLAVRLYTAMRPEGRDPHDCIQIALRGAGGFR